MKTPLQKTFDGLADKWENETAFLSSVTAMTDHESHKTIVSMGPAAVPFILERMKNRPGHWFAALSALTGQNPIDPAHRGNIRKMTDDWLAWGRSNGMIV